MSTLIELSDLINTQNTCKFCLDDISLLSKKSYITPCKCKGTIEYIHPSCLLQFFSFYKTTKCSLCMSSFSFIRWYHYFLIGFLSLIIYSLVFYVYFNMQLVFLFLFNYPSYTYKQLVLFKLSKYYFLAFDFWVTSLILIVFNLILNNGHQLQLLEFKTFSTLPVLSIKLTFKTILFQFVYYYLTFL